MAKKRKAEVVEVEETDVAPTGHPLLMPPAYLSKDGSDMWFRICAKLQEMGLLTDTAFPQVADYCWNWQIFCFNAQQVRDEDTPGVEIYSTGSRGLSANYKAATEARKAMVVFERYWGLNPMALSKIVLPKPDGEPEDEFDL